MSDMIPSQSMEFSFEGEFLGFTEPAHKCKYVRVNVLSEELHIKVAKSLRPFVKYTFRVGEQVQISGIGKLDAHTHQFKLKANRIIPLEVASPAVSTLACPEQLQPKHPTPCKPRIKIRVCQKSKCLKRGGKSLCESMEAALKDWDLHDQVAIEPTGCLGKCSSAPNLLIQPGKKLHSGICIKTLPKFERLVHTLLTTGKA